ncbi:MAG: transcriptional regulator [Vicinamibacteria bacterium]|nr:transcriptional regulator [Vicinamibacteria bacterium]
MRNAEVIRQWRILKTIEAGRYTSSKELADEHGVTERTIRRDIEALQEAGFPLYDDETGGRRIWRLVDGYRQRVTQTFTLSELAALHFGKNLMSILVGAPFGSDLETAFDKIRGALPEKALPYLARISDLFAARPDPFKDYSKKREVIASLVDAILHQRRVSASYYSFSSRRSKTYQLDPYRLVYWHGGLYLYARAHDYDEVRTFAVERLQKVDVTDSPFEVPRDFNVSEYARSAFGIAGGPPEKVELQFDKEIAGYVRERVWHESQQLEETADGGVVLRLQVAPNFELRTWIKGYLPHVRVLAPASLREELRREIAAAAEAFGA